MLGDGPKNRYALVCSECHSHNGMALKDEFEYLSEFSILYVVICYYSLIFLQVFVVLTATLLIKHESHDPNQREVPSHILYQKIVK